MSGAAKTHIGRGSGAQMEELTDATEGDIRCLGRWISQALAGCYLTSLPWPAIRTMAGFPPERGYFHIKRAADDPPQGLQCRLLFPWVNNYSDDKGGLGKDFGSTRVHMSFTTSLYCYFARCSCVD